MVDVSIIRETGPGWRVWVSMPAFLGLLFMPGVVTDVLTEIIPFVVLALGLVYGAESLMARSGRDLWETTRSWHLVLGAVLGATPGCGGAVAVVVAYASGRVSFGTMVAALTATTGDAAFVMLVGDPGAYTLIVSLQLFVAVVTGWFLDRFKIAPAFVPSLCFAEQGIVSRGRDWLFLSIMVPLLVIGFWGLTGHEVPVWVPVEVLSFVALAVGLAIWSVSPRPVASSVNDDLPVRMSEESSFILAWLLLAAVLVEVLVVNLSIEPRVWFEAAPMLAPVIGMAIGFIPGCGPQIALATLYLSGQAPLSAVAANAISNDGDALFPAIVKAPGPALWGTLASVPAALLVGYAIMLI